MDVTVEELTNEVIAFRDAREWRQFHTPSNLAMSISIEAGELLQVYQWGKGEGLESWDPACEELADVLIYSLSMCRELGVSADSIVRRKLKQNEKRYPLALSIGNALRPEERK